MSSDYLAEVLQCAPSTWTQTSYTSSNYVTVQLTKQSSEYEGIVSALRATHTSLAEQISKIERVQHPFAYGRFVLRQEQLEKRTGTKRIPTRYFLQVQESELKAGLEYNMDARRTPLDSSNMRTTVDKCVVLVQSLGAPSSWKRDCECYPEYVVYYTGTLPAKTTPSSSQYRHHRDHQEPDFLDNLLDDVHNDHEPDFLENLLDDVHNDHEPDFLENLLDDVHNDYEPDFLENLLDDVHNDHEPDFLENFLDDVHNDYEPDFLENLLDDIHNDY